MSLKALQLEPWMIWSFKNKQQELIEMGYTKTTPRFKRNGWYKHDRFSWFEINGKAFTHPDRSRINEDFDYCLKQLNHKPLTDWQRNAIKRLIAERLAPRSMKELYYADTDWRSLRETKRHSQFSVAKAIRKIRKGRKHNA